MNSSFHRLGPLGNSIKRLGPLNPPDVVDTGGGGGGYVADAVHFDGATSLRNGSFSLVGTSTSLSWVVWLRADPFNSGGQRAIFLFDPENNYQVGAFVQQSDAIRANTTNTDLYTSNGGPEIVETYSNAAVMDDSWHSIIYTGRCDLASGSNARKYYIDGIDSTNLIQDTGPFVMTLGGVSLWIGSDSFSWLTADVADFRLMPNTYLISGSDIPVETLRLFVDANGKPVDPAVATAALGAPAVLLSGDASTFATNQGTADAFITTGTLTNATTSPSD